MNALQVGERPGRVDQVDERPSLLSPLLVVAALATLVALVWALTWTAVI